MLTCHLQVAMFLMSYPKSEYINTLSLLKLILEKNENILSLSVLSNITATTFSIASLKKFNPVD